MLRLLILFSFLLISGCARIQEKIETILWEQSGAADDVSYQQYRQLASKGELDGDGLYRSEELERMLASVPKVPEGAVHVSFARNEFLQVKYYRDEAMTEELPAENCRLDPGDTIYASEPVLSDSAGPLYRFSGFQVREFDSAGRMKGLLAESREIPGPVCRIPDDFSGTEIAVIPLGEYRNRTVTLRGYSPLPDGQMQVLENGVWEINGKRYGNVSVEIKPMESCRVVYDYSAYKEDWYFVESTPESYWDNSSDGTITFMTTPSDEERVDYSVRLHPYGQLTIGNAVSFLNPVDSFIDSASAIFGNKSVIETQNIISLVQVNGISAVNNFSDTEVALRKLRAGDEILIRIPGELKLISDTLTLPRPEQTDSEWTYRFTIPDGENMAHRISVGRRNSDPAAVWQSKDISRGRLTVYDSLGVEYSEGSEAPAENERVTVVITPDEGYCVYGKNVKDNVYRADMSYAEFAGKFDEITFTHPIRPGIMVTLDPEDELGECTFWSGNEQISGQVMLREGQDLQFDYILRQDAGLEITLAPEDRGEAINIWSPYAANRELFVTDAMDGSTLRCRDFLTFKEGTVTNAPADPF